MGKRNDPNVVFWERTERKGADECWPWTGGTTSLGYGAVWVGGRLRKATHIALELHGKPRRGRALALHSCDNPNCVNPNHLRWGSHQDNSDDKFQRNRSITGITKPSALIRNKKLVAAVLASSDGSTTLARKLGVSKPTVLRIRQGHGVTRRQRPPTVMMDRVWTYMASLAPVGDEIEVNQTHVGKALGLASSNVNVAIRLLERDGRIERLSKNGCIWRYRLLPSQ